MTEKTDDLGDLASGDWDFIEGMASRLEAAWKKGGGVDLAPLLPAAGTPLRKKALEELIKVDLECRWTRGQPVVLDYYVDKFPELGRARDLSPKLIFEEYRVRHLFGDKPSIALYQTRFAKQFAEFTKLLDSEPLPTVQNPGTDDDLATVQKPPKEPKRTRDGKATMPEPSTRGADLGPSEMMQVGEFRRLERLGAGAFGEVWKAEMPGGILKAVKIIFRPIDHEEAKRELEALELIKSLRHHFLLQTISFRPTNDRLFILMDLADCSLRDLLKKNKKEGKGGLAVADLVRWIREAAEALDFLHEKGVQHRDIKPENILLSEGSVRVADFGLARHQATRRLVSGSGAGTPLYMPPEAWNDKVHANSDQYSLAATYAECRLGNRIYKSEGMASLMQAHVHDKPSLDPLPPNEQKVLLKALAKNPEHRYASCMAFAEDLIRVIAPTLPPGSLKGLITTEDSTATLRLRKKQKQEHALFLIAGVIGVSVVAALLAMLMWPYVFLPPSAAAGAFRPVDGAEVVDVAGKRYYKQIELPLAAKPDVAVRFNLIPWTDKGKQPFYMMQDKMSNDVYEVFARANPQAENGSRWRLGARGEWTPRTLLYPSMALHAGPPLSVNFLALCSLKDPRANAEFSQMDWPQPEDLGLRDMRWPALRVDIQEAHRCAEWLGGVLPSAEQWDKAAGRFEPNAGDGPYQSPFSPGEIAIERDERGPVPVGTSAKDVNLFSGCRDMSGNGFEWTRTILFDETVGEYFGDASKINPLAKTPLRGQSFKQPEPLKYADLKDRPLDVEFFLTKRPPGYDSEIGFRVALIP